MADFISALLFSSLSLLRVAETNHSLQNSQNLGLSSPENHSSPINKQPDYCFANLESLRKKLEFVLSSKPAVSCSIGPNIWQGFLASVLDSP